MPDVPAPVVRAVLVTILVALTMAAAPAFPQSAPRSAPDSRAAALAALGDPRAAVRLGGIVWFADHGAMRDSEPLLARLRDDEPVLREIAERALWRLWSRSGSESVDRRMQDGVEAMQAERFDEAIAIFSAVIRERPDYAEGWNKRATVYYLAGAYRKSIDDCDQVLRRNPNHFGALSGAGQNWLRLEQPERALSFMRRALEVNPNMDALREQLRRVEEGLRQRGRFST